MDVIKKYGEMIKNTTENNPKRACGMIKLGLKEETIRHGIKAEKGMPKGYAKLNHMALKSVLATLEHPEKTVWTNIFAPVEIMQCFDLQCISMECMSSFFSGFQIEDYFIDQAENAGIAATLCSYHKNFIGGVNAGVIPKADLSVTTSMICDGNVNTFRYLQEKHQVPSFVIDVPNEYSKMAESYVVEQLKELIQVLEERYHKKMDMERLKETLRRENESKRLYRSFLQKQRGKYYPNTMTLHLYMLFATHLNIGSPECLSFFQLLERDIDQYPEFHGKGILWIHLLPYYQETLKNYFNYEEKYYIQACELNVDYMEELDVEHPLEALARKMILNIFNGSYERKAKAVADLVKELDSDGVIHFCHWGCKQSAGGVMLMKEEMRRLEVPMLALDGDAMDRRNSHDGQIKTRLEAFLELIDNMEDETDDRLCV